MVIGNIGAAVPLNDPSQLISSQTQVQSKATAVPKEAIVPSTKVDLSPTAVTLNKEALGEAKTNEPLSSAGVDAKKSDDEQNGGVKSFAYGALGMDHPDKVEQKEDDSYTAGQFLKAAATVGSVIAMFV